MFQIMLNIWAVVGRHPSPPVPPLPPARDDASAALQAVIAPAELQRPCAEPLQHGGQDDRASGAKCHAHHRRKRKRKPVLV